MAGFNWGDSKKFSSNNRDTEKLSDIVETVEYPGGEYGAYRFVGAPKATAMHWITTLGKTKDGKKSKVNFFPKACLGFDPETHEVDAEKCPYCTVLELSPRVEVRQNVIDREVQDNEPKKAKPPSKFEQKLRPWNGGKHYVKEGKSKGGHTPVRVLLVGPAIGGPIAEITSLNKHKNKAGDKVAYGPDDPRKGFDVMVKYDKDQPPAKMYQVQKGDINPLTDEEKAYPIWDIPDHEAEAFKDADKEAKRVKPFLCNREGELTFPDAAKSADGKTKKRNKYEDSFDEDDDAEEDDEDDRDDDEDDDDDDDRPSKKGKSKSKSKTSSKSKSKSKSRDDDDDDDDDDDSDDDDGEAPWDDDEDEDDDDDRPSKKGKSKSKSKTSSKSKSKSKSRDDDEDDDDDDSDDDDDDDGEAPWDDDEDEDDDEDDRKSSKSKSKSKTKAAPSKTKTSVKSKTKRSKLRLKRPVRR